MNLFLETHLGQQITGLLLSLLFAENHALLKRSPFSENLPGSCRLHHVDSTTLPYMAIASTADYRIFWVRTTSTSIRDE
jgi:hypothetical protein